MNKVCINIFFFFLVCVAEIHCKKQYMKMQIDDLSENTKQVAITT